MNEELVVEIGQQTIEMALLVALPLLLISLVIGLTVSLFQVATSLQDVTLSFVPKILGVGVVLILAGSWMLQTLVRYTLQIFQRIPEFIG